MDDSVAKNVQMLTAISTIKKWATSKEALLMESVVHEAKVEGCSIRQIADMLGVSKSKVERILNKREGTDQ